MDWRPYFADGLNWLFIGGESGEHRAPMNLRYLADTIEQCRAAKVPVFVKQDSALRSETRGRIS